MDAPLVDMRATPRTERISDQLIRLPFHNVLTGADQEQVIEAILEFKF